MSTLLSVLIRTQSFVLAAWLRQRNDGQYRRVQDVLNPDVSDRFFLAAVSRQTAALPELHVYIHLSAFNHNYYLSLALVHSASLSCLPPLTSS